MGQCGLTDSANVTTGTPNITACDRPSACLKSSCAPKQCLGMALITIVRREINPGEVASGSRSLTPRSFSLSQ